MPVTTAVIPAAGFGTRILPATKAIPKEMLAIVDKPMIQLVVEEAAGAGITDVVIVISRDKTAVRDHFTPAPELEAALEAKGKDDLLAATKQTENIANVTFAYQDEALGLGHAVLCAREAVGDKPFAVLLPDELFGGSTLLRALIDAYDEYTAPVIAVMEMGDDIVNYGVVDPDPITDDLVRMKDFIEKPTLEVAPSNLGSIGRYVLSPAVFDELTLTKPGSGDEIQLTDAVASVARDKAGYAYIHRGQRHDAGRPLGYVKAIIELAKQHPDIGDDVRAFLGLGGSGGSPPK